ncbi:hypothetical protein DPMN_064472 [Dreissena polymorpha]|uniref:Homeobox domain-containing protein n=1 Tax=Dreissena polymorpha TaxID=45954 RepID=A0A9D4CDN1_DREPO|nr:hypothetical protein DPMN_064472 [Dreissena polymorpha]
MIDKINKTSVQGKGRSRRERTTFSRDQLTILEYIFKKTKHPDAVARKKTAKELDLTDNHVLIWFKNRRAKEKKQQRNHLSTSKKNSNQNNKHNDDYVDPHTPSGSSTAESYCPEESDSRSSFESAESARLSTFYSSNSWYSSCDDVILSASNHLNDFMEWHEDRTSQARREFNSHFCDANIFDTSVSCGHLYDTEQSMTSRTYQQQEAYIPQSNTKRLDACGQNYMHSVGSDCFFLHQTTHANENPDQSCRRFSDIRAIYNFGLPLVRSIESRPMNNDIENELLATESFVYHIL